MSGSGDILGSNVGQFSASAERITREAPYVGGAAMTAFELAAQQGGVEVDYSDIPIHMLTGTSESGTFMTTDESGDNHS